MHNPIFDDPEYLRAHVRAMWARYDQINRRRQWRKASARYRAKKKAEKQS